MNSAVPSLFGLLGRYRVIIGLLAVLTILANGLSVAVPRIIAVAIDAYAGGHLVLESMVIELSVVVRLLHVPAAEDLGDADERH